MVEQFFDYLDKGDFVMGSAVLAAGIFLYKFIWSRGVSKNECKRVHDLEAKDRA